MFSRKNQSRSDSHVDCYTLEGLEEPWKASVIIPIQNVDNSYMYWINGEYNLEVTYNRLREPYYTIVWNSDQTLVYETEIAKSSVCRVDTPHGARTTNEKIRIVATIRFKNNPSFEDVVASLSDS